MWKLIRRLTEFANNPSTSWPSPDRGDYLAANANFMKTHAKIIEQVFKIASFYHVLIKKEML